MFHSSVVSRVLVKLSACWFVTSLGFSINATGLFNIVRELVVTVGIFVVSEEMVGFEILLL